MTFFKSTFDIGASREVRMVPENWEHPKEGTKFIPLFNSEGLEEKNRDWDEGKEIWNKGTWANLKGEEKNTSYADYVGERPSTKNNMPIWGESEVTHYMLYETTSEGTPISKACATIDELISDLMINDIKLYANRQPSRNDWMQLLNLIT